MVKASHGRTIGSCKNIIEWSVRNFSRKRVRHKKWSDFTSWL